MQKKEQENERNRILAELLVGILEAHGIGSGVTFHRPAYTSATITLEAMRTICHRLEDPRSP